MEYNTEREQIVISEYGRNIQVMIRHLLNIEDRKKRTEAAHFIVSVMSTRTLPSERDRKMTILLTPFMSCTAKLPVYAFFVNAFFKDYAGWIMTGLYFMGILVGILIAFLYKNTLFKGEAVPFVMELPNYRMPSAKNVGQLLWEKAKDFLQKAFSVILLATVVFCVFFRRQSIFFNIVIKIRF